MNTLPLDTIICGDAAEILATFPAESVNLIVTSPPYPGQKGDKRTVAEWLEWLDNILALMCRVLTPDGVLALNVMFKRDAEGWFDIRLFTCIPALLQAHGLNAIDTYQFVKPNPAPNGPLTYCDIPAWEPVFLVTKAGRVEDVPFYPYRRPHKPKSLSSDGTVYSTRLHNGKTGDGSTIRPHPAGARQTNVLSLSSSGDQGRPKAAGQSFPLGLPMRFVLQHTRRGDVVLDPFAGVGTTCKAAQMAGRHWIGIEIVETEAHHARHWLRPRANKPDPAGLPLLQFAANGAPHD